MRGPRRHRDRRDPRAALACEQRAPVRVRHAFLQKPFTRASLLDKVREVLAAPVESPG